MTEREQLERLIIPPEILTRMFFSVVGELSSSIFLTEVCDCVHEEYTNTYI